MEDQPELAHAKEIQSALISLMLNMSYKAIRVHHIVEEAGISRNTFYRCFKNKDQVISAIYDEAMGEFLSKVDEEIDEANLDPDSPKDIVFEIISQIFSGIHEHRDSAKLIFSAGIDQIIYSRFSLFFNRLCGKLIRRRNLHVNEDRMIEFLLSHLTGSAFHFIQEWVLDDDPPPPEKMAQLYTRILTPNLELIAELAEAQPSA